VTMVTAIRDAVGAGVMAPNEGRAKFDLKPVKGGDQPYLQQQNYSLEALAKRDAQEDPFAPAKPPTPQPAPVDAKPQEQPPPEPQKQFAPPELAMKIAAAARMLHESPVLS
jgi:phage portal protein BeeE